MKIAIIGAGFTGLTAAIDLAAAGHNVTIFERDSLPGGLASGFSTFGWDWQLEKHYHHIFTSDTDIITLARKVGHPFVFYHPKTSIYYSHDIQPFDSPITLLKYPHLSLIDKLRTAAGMAFLIANPFWQPLEHITSEQFIKFVMGEKSWRILWQPLFAGKFGDYLPNISASWFWARIHKRSPSLGYPNGGFTSLISSVAKYASQQHVKIAYNTGIKNISNCTLTTDAGKKYQFDKVICTLPTLIFTKITSDLPTDYVNKLNQLTGIGAVNLVLSLKKSLLVDGTYWLNMNDRKFPFLAVVEHTNFIDKSHYKNQHLVYVGNYLPVTHKYFKYTVSQLISEFSPYLRKINPDFSSKDIISSWKWPVPFAQPIVTKNYSQMLPQLKTPIPDLYLANIQQVYPWDRGTNYAVELGHKVAALCIKD